MIQWCEPYFNEEERTAVMCQFANGCFTQGDKVKQFETELTNLTGKKHCIAVSNGTVALELVWKRIGIEGQKVICPGFTYFATAASIINMGGIPVFVDCDKAGNIDTKYVEHACELYRPKAIVYIDFGGNSANKKELKRIANHYECTLVHDGAHSIGLDFVDDYCTTSFHLAKVITTIEGGAIFTDNEDDAVYFRSIRSQGETEKYKHTFLGTNARMTDIQAAIGIEQLKKLDEILKIRQWINDSYNARLDEGIVRIWNNGNNFLYSILVNDRNSVRNVLKLEGIDTRVCYPMPVYEQESFKNFPWINYGCVMVYDICSRILCLPIYPGLTDEKIKTISEVVNNGIL